MTSTREHADALGEATEQQQPIASAVPALSAGTASSHASEAVQDDPLIVEELLVEDVSIDGMCGVY